MQELDFVKIVDYHAGCKWNSQKQDCSCWKVHEDSRAGLLRRCWKCLGLLRAQGQAPFETCGMLENTWWPWDCHMKHDEVAPYKAFLLQNICFCLNKTKICLLKSEGLLRFFSLPHLLSWYILLFVTSHFLLFPHWIT